MTDWLDYADVYPGPDHTVVGTVKLTRDVYSPQLDDRRDILVYLPPSYNADPGRHYPVLYMHDGQNLFDAATSGFGEWGVDEVLESLSAAGIEAIVVGIPHLEDRRPGLRAEQYLPCNNVANQITGVGDQYVAFICDTIRPLIDADFRTLPDRAATGVMGSSLGGLISLYALFARPEVFGFAGVMSPAFFFCDDDAIFNFVAGAGKVAARIYMDVGTAEMDHIPPEERGDITSQLYLDSSRRMDDILRGKGCQPGADYRYLEEQDGIHHESAWHRRLPDALRFWLKP